MEVLETDYHEFVDKDGASIVENLCFSVMMKIAEYCTHRGMSVKDELVRAKQGIE